MIIGITGTLGAGKGTVVEYLKKKDFRHYSVTAFITDEIIRRGLPVNRDNMILVANDLRAEYGSAYIVEKLYERASVNGGDSVIESIRTVGEVDALKEKIGFYLFAVNAEMKTRYDRIVKRAGEKDSVTFEQFAEQEKQEMTSTDPNKQNLAECIRRADYLINNDGTIEDLNNQVEKILQKIST
ncbi:MAG: AAA family ATPase [Candidatus Paceibacterota bacterium]|jgi:dephospho-CoA kinase